MRALGTTRMEMRQYEQEERSKKKERLERGRKKKEEAVQKHLQGRITASFKRLTFEGRREWQGYLLLSEEERELY